MQTHVGYPQQMPEMAKRVYEVAGDNGRKKIAVVAFKYSGAAMADNFLSQLKHYTENFDFRVLSMEDADPTDTTIYTRPRGIASPSNELIVPGAETLVVFSDETRSGWTLASLTGWGAKFGKGHYSKVYSALYKDRAGIANFAEVAEYDNWIGIRNYLQTNQRRFYDELASDGSIDLIEPDFLMPESVKSSRHLAARLFRELVDYVDHLETAVEHRKIARAAMKEASSLRAAVGDDNLAVLTPANTDKEILKMLTEFFGAEGVKFDIYLMGYKPGTGSEIVPPKNIFIPFRQKLFRQPNKRKVLLLYGVMRNGCYVPAAVWALDNAEDIGLKEGGLYLGAFADYTGVADFAVIRGNGTKEHRGLANALRDNEPSIYSRLEREGKLRYIGGVPEDLKRLETSYDPLLQVAGVQYAK